MTGFKGKYKPSTTDSKDLPVIDLNAPLVPDDKVVREIIDYLDQFMKEATSDERQYLTFDSETVCAQYYRRQDDGQTTGQGTEFPKERTKRILKG